ncbi:MAG: T9SS type A sorting domain-containing protein [Ignavibacteriales bacterium]|nr:T9SS type A sorting domain-containing protein [Ignavibacteriales bacterium]
MIQWALNGILVCNYEHSQGSPKVVSDINGGVIIVWEDSRSESFSDIYAQSINSNGLVKWNANGVPICTSTQTQKNTQIISNNSGSAIITWEDFRNGIQEIFTQKIDSSGVVQWKINGESVCRYPARGYSPAIVGYNHGGAIICWNDYRNGLNSDIYAQEINADGVVEWTTNGIPICTTPFEQSDPQLVEDESGGAIITWGDGGDQGSIYAQRVNQDGVIQWKLDGVPICTATGDQAFAQIVSDGKAGAIITWQDHRFGNWDIYASKIDCAGNLGNPTLLENEISIQKNYLLAQNYPNPFNPSTKINYQIGNESIVQLKVYDVLGNEVARLVDEYKVSGSYEIEFNASQLSSGIYFYKLRAGGFVETKKMILLR